MVPRPSNSFTRKVTETSGQGEIWTKWGEGTFRSFQTPGTPSPKVRTVETVLERRTRRCRRRTVGMRRTVPTVSAQDGSPTKSGPLVFLSLEPEYPELFSPPLSPYPLPPPGSRRPI